MGKQRKDAPPITEDDLKRADAALKRLLSSPPAPFTPKAKKAPKKK